jgi:acetyl-CoA synthetase
LEEVKMLSGRTYEAVRNNFRWQIPEYYNIGIDVCDRWADVKNRLALIYPDAHGKERRYTFRELKKLSKSNNIRISRSS